MGLNDEGAFHGAFPQEKPHPTKARGGTVIVESAVPWVQRCSRQPCETAFFVPASVLRSRSQGAPTPWLCSAACSRNAKRWASCFPSPTFTTVFVEPQPTRTRPL